MIRWYLLTFLLVTLLVTSLIATEQPLIERLKTAQSGDFIVLEANKTITLLAIRSTDSHCVVLEEISAPSPKNKPMNWAEWIQKRAPGHTSWSMIEIDLEEKEVLEAYSFTQAAWISTSAKDNFLANLVRLPLTSISKEQLRRIGPAPLDGEPDLRKIWSPPLFVEGNQIKAVSFNAYETAWPQDGSELAGKTLSLYFDLETRSPFPYWIQVDTGQVTAALRTVDSGHNLPASSYRAIPKRAPKFLTVPVKTNNGGLRFSLQSPKYYKEFELFAVDITTQDKQIHSLNHIVLQGAHETVQLEIEAEELMFQLQPNHVYTWLVIPTARGGAYGELNKPFTWVP